MKEHETLEQIGRETVGPAFCVHLHLTALLAAHHRLDRLYFLARDGHLMKELYPLFAELTPDYSPPLHYLHVSRRSTALTAVRRLGPRELVQSRCLSDVLQELGLADPEVEETVSHLGYRERRDSAIAPEHDLRLHQLLDDVDFRQLVDHRTRAARALLRKYLLQQRFLEGGRVGLIDVGWSGTIQDNLTRALSEENGRPEVSGIYLGYLPPSGVRSQPSGEKIGTLFDHRRSADLSERSASHLVELFEQAGRSEEGTTIGYVENNAVVLPVFHGQSTARAAERAAWPAVSALQSGIRRSVKEYVRRVGGSDRNDLLGARLTAQKQIERFIFCPTQGEINAVSALVHCEDEDRHTSLAPFLKRAAFLSPRRFFTEFYRSPWKPAYLAQTLGRPACHLFRSYERAKLRWIPQLGTNSNSLDQSGQIPLFIEEYLFNR